MRYISASLSSSMNLGLCIKIIINYCAFLSLSIYLLSFDTGIRQRAYETLLRRTHTEPWVFTINGSKWTKNSLTQRFKSKVKKANLNPDYHWHTLRHTFASWLVQRGVSIMVVSKLLGHSTVKTTEIYAHLKQGNLDEAINKLE